MLSCNAKLPAFGDEVDSADEMIIAAAKTIFADFIKKYSVGLTYGE